MKVVLLILSLTLAACGHDQALLKAQADAATVSGQARVAEANAAAEEAKAVQALAAKVDAGGASAYLIAKAMKGLGAQAQSVQVAAQPQSLVGLAWQSVLQVADIALRGYGIKAARDVGITQSNNQRDVALSTNSAFVGMGNSIASAGAAGYPYIQAPGAITTNTLSGTGVLGSGTYTGPVTTTTTRNCNGGTTTAGNGTTAGGAGGTAAGGTC